MSSSPALNAIEHPIYDVWLLKCQNSDLKNAKIVACYRTCEKRGEMAEWSKAAVSKTVNGVTRSGVRIPFSPPFIFPLPISGKKRIFYSKALKVVGVKGFA